MDVVEKARELGAALQKDERYLKFREAQKANGEDDALNELIGQTRLIQFSYQREAARENKDEDKLAAYEKEFETICGLVAENPNMKAFEAAKAEVDALIKYINGILTLCLEGEDPAVCDPDAARECSGECLFCAGRDQ